MGRDSWEADGFLSFRTMISPKLIRFLYVLGAIGITIVGVLTIIGAFEARRAWGGTGVSGVGILWGIGIIVLGNLLWRVFCEGLILLFNIHDLLDSIERRFRSFSSPDSSSMSTALSSIVKELKGGTSRLLSIEKALKETLQLMQTQRAQPPPEPGREPDRPAPPPWPRPPQSQSQPQPQRPPTQLQSQSPGATSGSAAMEIERAEPRPRRHWGRWLPLLLLLALGIFVALPIVSGHAKPDGLEPQAISEFLRGIWDYWVQVVRGLR